MFFHKTFSINILYVENNDNNMIEQLVIKNGLYVTL